MKRTFNLLLLVIALFVFSQSKTGIVHENIAFERGKVVIEKVYSSGLENNMLGDSPQRDVSIYLPPLYDSLDLNYPVIYLLHGYNLKNTVFYSGSYFKIHLQGILDSLINSSIIEPIIVVTPNCWNSYGGSWYTNSIVTGNWEDFVIYDVVEFMDNNYRTLPNAESRGIAGHSMGGYGSMKLAMKHPDIFGAVYSISGVLVFEHVLLDAMKEFQIQAIEQKVISDYQRWQVRAQFAAAAAFSPDTNKICLGDFPFTAIGDTLPGIMERWLSHDVFTMIPEYKNNMLKLRAIQFDGGIYDQYFIGVPDKFSEELSYYGIEHTRINYNGNHSNKVPERFRKHVLPFFDMNLVH